jgi:hypothetical protein
MGNRKLEDLFNMTHSDNATENETVAEVEKVSLPKLQELDETLDKIDIALPSVKDLEASDEEMDELADLSKKAFQDLLDLGLSVDPRFGGQLAQTAASMMTNAINAKNAKIEKKLRMVELQLRKASLDQKERILQAKQKPEEDETETGQGVVMDRNALLKEILSNTSTEKK